MRIAFPLLLALVVGACRPGSSSPRNDDEVPPGGEGAPGAPTASEAPKPSKPIERCAGGVPWNGVPSGCAYEVGGCCYTDAEHACAAAGCEAGACEILETYPAQVRCRGGAPAAAAAHGGSGTSGF